MDTDNLLTEGLALLLLGMGTVFVFLTLLVLATRLMSFLVMKYAPQEAPAPAASPADDPALVAAVTAAVHLHRRKQRRQEIARQTVEQG